MYKVDLPVDNSTDVAVERRRVAEAARQARIFNTRSRIIGLDLKALDLQVAEKNERKEMESQREKAFDMLMVTQGKALMAQQIEEEEMRTQLNRDLVQYRALQQRPEDSRDADLKFDHQGTVWSTVRISETDLGPASMQVFQGEGIKENEKRRAQMEKTERELRAQKEDNEKKRMESKHRELLQGKERRHEDLRAIHLDALEEECKKAACIALNNYNLAQAAEQAERQKMEHVRQEGEGFAEIWHTVASDMLTECPKASESLVGGAGGPRVLTDRWRGMTAEQLRDIEKERDEQRAQRERQRVIEKQQEAASGAQLLELARQAEEEERRHLDLQRERRVQMDKYNEQLAEEQRAHQEYLKKQVYTNKPTAHYFTQFNSSSR
ncbi:RIB43A-like with coiled-coils protein 1 [Aplochiton taeniatus]